MKMRSPGRLIPLRPAARAAAMCLASCAIAAGAEEIPPDDAPAGRQAQVAALLDGLRAEGKGPLADLLKARFERSARDLAARKSSGHTIYGRVSVLGPDKPELVNAQMRIMEGGYFVDSIGEPGKPVGFRLHGYEPVDVVPVGEPGSVENVGMVVLAPIHGSRTASIRGLVVLEGQAGAPGVTATLGIQTGPINNPSGGYEGGRGVDIPPASVSPGGELSASGLVPTKHYLYVRKPGYWMDSRTVDLRPGQALDVGAILLELADRVTVTQMVAKGPSFADARPLTLTADGAGGWPVGGEGRDTQYLLFLHLPNGGEVRLRSSHGPFDLADLGEGTIEEMAKVDQSKVRFANQARLPAVSGHVYLGRWGFSNDWVLFRIEREKMTVEETRRLGPDRP